MRRLLLLVSVAALALPAGAQAAAPPVLPSDRTPNAPGSIKVPFSLSTPPAARETRSYAQLLELWRAAGAAYGVPWEVLGAVNKIESNFGRNMGPSSAGAVGWMQFMPSTWARWGTDGDGDGLANPWDPEDAVYAAARYLAASGAREDLARAIFAYNHADWYVRDVLELASVFAGGGGFDGSLVAGSSGASLDFVPGAGGGADVVFRLDNLEKRLVKARRAVNAAQRTIDRSEKRLRKLDVAVLAAERRAGDPALDDAAFQLLEAELTRLVVARDGAVEDLARARAKLDAAVARLEDVRAVVQAHANEVTFTRPIAAGLGTPTFAGQYVFPVGGGPSVVSVAADHHDYPAADIAAPEGSPLYALADSFVVRTYPSATGRCGIGLQIRLADGRNYLYCHLSYLEPHVTEGAALTAGAPVGLVGSTGNSTGPHLHLQLVPTSGGYPQKEAWFQSFAGVAFSWQGAPPAPVAPAAPVAASAGGDVITFTRGG
jgi:murein DD-endopeptidase MepM/ murein hydrolase activator NlpD